MAELEKTTWEECVRLVSAAEKVNAFAWIISEAYHSVRRAGVAAPDLAPELTQVEAGLDEISAHLEQAARVLSTKIDILRERLEEGRAE